MPAKRPIIFDQGCGKQRGAALMVMLVILIIGAAVLLVSALNSSSIQIERDKVTADALAKAKEALIGYAIKVQLSSSNASNQPRPGDLPCPDIHTPGTSLEGISSTPCSGSALGRLPWKTLGLPDLRDSSGERLWYAVSTNFKNSPRSGTLNSDTPGTITVRNSSGNIINNGCVTYGLPNCPNPSASDTAFGTGAVAVIIAPGEVLTRQGSGTAQDRSAAGINTASNYLDIATVGGNTEDNANYTDGSSSNGFIQSRIKDSNGNLIVNDQLLVITQDNIMQTIQKRVVGEVKQCLIEYASINNGRYPWAVPLTDLTNYNDATNQLFGRIPDDLDKTNTDSGGGIIMDNKWGPMCNTHNNNTAATWWLNWREMVFYGLANAYKPFDPPNTPATCGTCLSVNPPSATADKKFVVIVAGKTLATTLPPQVRITSLDKGTLGNYLEAPNPIVNPPPFPAAFSQQQPTAIFNDTVVFP
jgi:hypothetical protein